MNDENSVEKPWYQQFWPWFIISIPLSSVIVGCLMLYLSLQRYDGVVKDNYYKEGLAINQRLDLEKNAASMKIQAQIQIDEVTGQVFTKLQTQSSDIKSEEPLLIQIIYPINSQKDQSILAHYDPSQKRYVGHLNHSLRGKYYLHLSDQQHTEWVVKGEAYFPLGDDGLTLKSRL